MKSFLICLSALILVTSGSDPFIRCPDDHQPVCGRVRNTNTCRTFKNQCKFDLLNNGDYDEVDMNYCVDKLRIVPCLIRDRSTSRNCGDTCAPFATAHVCACQLDEPDTCKYFRNQCELDNNKCDHNQPLYDLANKLKCTGLPKYRENP